MELKTDYAHWASVLAPAPGAPARPGEVAGGLNFLSLDREYGKLEKLVRAANIKLLQ